MSLITASRHQFETGSLFLFDPGQLRDLGGSLGPSFQTASPVPHCVLDDFLPEEVAARLLDEFPGMDNFPWRQHNHSHSRKLSCNNEQHLRPFTRWMIYQLHSGPFLRFLEELTGIKALLPDPHLEGGGWHQIERNGRLEIHADFNWHPQLQLDRRLNLLLFLNRDWHESYGGAFELWDRDMTRCVKSFLPLYNRCVIFTTTDWSYHGHPHPLMCPPERTRKSLALYYYTVGRPAEERSAPHSTLYQTRGDEKHADRPQPKGVLRSLAGWVGRGICQASKVLRYPR